LSLTSLRLEFPVGVVDFSKLLKEARPVRRFSICFRVMSLSIEVPLVIPAW